jgi:hypothetical protein
MSEESAIARRRFGILWRAYRSVFMTRYDADPGENRLNMQSAVEICDSVLR